MFRQRLVNFLHFYQPYNQQEDILDRIVNESYRPLVQGLQERPEVKLVINASGVLIKLLVDKGYDDVVKGFSNLLDRGNTEFTASAMYHAFLPLLPKDEVLRQIDVDMEISKKYLSPKFDPIGFFSPEMAINSYIADVISEYGFKWVPAAQVAYGNEVITPDKLFKIKGTKLHVFFRNKRVSTLMLSALSRTPKDFIEDTADIHSPDTYWFTVMDAETYGHHRIGHEKFFFGVVDNNFFETMTVTELLNTYTEVEEVELRPSTWTNEEQDFWLDKDHKEFTDAKSFVLWKDSTNKVHNLQWELTNYVIDTVNSYENKNLQSWKDAREILDEAVASDQFWWASAKPWWSLEMIEQGAYTLLQVLKTLGISGTQLQHADNIYRRILDQAFEWQRNGYIRKRHLDASSTYMKKPFKERAPIDWYNHIITEFEDEMKKAAEEKQFEKAVKWRDAIIKLHTGTDIYDILHVVDELWSVRTLPTLRHFLLRNWDDFSDYAKQYFLHIYNAEDFEKFKLDSKDLIDEIKRKHPESS